MICKKTALDTALAVVAPGLTPNSYVILATTITLHIADGALYLISAPDDGEVWYSGKVGDTTETFPTVSVDGAKFTKAVSYCGDESIELIPTEDSLLIKNSKGTLKLPILVDDSGEPAAHEFATPTGDELTVQNLDQLKLLTGTLSKTMDSVAERCVYTDSEVSFGTDEINISKGASLVSMPMLLSARMVDFCKKYSDVQIFNAGDVFWFVSKESGAAARFSNVFQDFIPSFPLDGLKEEFAGGITNSVQVNMADFMSSMQFLAIVADSANDNSVIVSQPDGPDELVLTCADSVQKIPCKCIKSQDKPWSIAVDCLSAIARFGAYDGYVQLDVYNSMLACVGPVTTSIGIIE